MDASVVQLLEKKAAEFGVSLESREFALRMDETDTCAHLRGLFNYPKMKDLPNGSITYIQTQLCVRFHE